MTRRKVLDTPSTHRTRCHVFDVWTAVFFFFASFQSNQTNWIEQARRRRRKKRKKRHSTRKCVCYYSSHWKERKPHHTHGQPFVVIIALLFSFVEDVSFDINGWLLIDGKLWTALDLINVYFSGTESVFLDIVTISMGIYYSLMSVFSPSTSTHNANVHSANRLEHRIRSKSLKKRRRRHKRHHLSNRFFLGSNHFSANAQPHTCLFHEYYTLNSSRETLQPVHLQLSLPESNRATVLSPIQCSMAVRRDSLKLIHHTEDSYSIDFTFDADRPFRLYSASLLKLTFMFLNVVVFSSFSVYFMAHETITNSNGALSYVCCTKLNRSDTFKQCHAFIRPAGHGQIFSSIQHDIRFSLSALNEESYGCTISHRLYPIVIVCQALNNELTK